jgi:hypothetical protein
VQHSTAQHKPAYCWVGTGSSQLQQDKNPTGTGCLRVMESNRATRDVRQMWMDPSMLDLDAGATMTESSER